MDNRDVSHDGHRERLTNLVQNSGLENVSEIQAVEYFLTYIFPRGDVNPLAHRLLDKFENFSNIIYASISDLKSIKGINDRSAMKISHFAQLFDLFVSSTLNERVNIDDKEDLMDMFEQLLRFKPTENLYLFGFNNKGDLLHKRKFNRKSINSVEINPFEFYDFINSVKPLDIIVVHNHPGGTAEPSIDDIEALDYIMGLAKNLDCHVINSFIVGADGIYSQTQFAFVRYFHNVGGIVNSLAKINSTEKNDE